VAPVGSRLQLQGAGGRPYALGKRRDCGRRKHNLVHCKAATTQYSGQAPRCLAASDGPGLPDEVPATAGGDSDGDLPVPVQKACEHARVYDDAGSAGVSRKRRLPCCLLSVQRTSAPRTWLTPLNTWPAHSPVNASLAASRLHAHDLGSVWLATPCTVTDFHPLPSAGLPAHPDHPISSGNARYFQWQRGVEFAGITLNPVRSTGDQRAERRL
jgi:hypothetical protein